MRRVLSQHAAPTTPVLPPARGTASASAGHGEQSHKHSKVWPDVTFDDDAHKFMRKVSCSGWDKGSSEIKASPSLGGTLRALHSLCADGLLKGVDVEEMWMKCSVTSGSCPSPLVADKCVWRDQWDLAD